MKQSVALGLSGGVDPGNSLAGSRGLRPRVARARLRGKLGRVALGLSGGVDSAVTAFLLKKQGYDVHCIYLNCFDENVPGCRTKEDRKDALVVALQLKLPFQVLDFRKEYEQSVIEYFKREYEAGRTPNPDVVCNRDIKFGLFWDWAVVRNNFDFVATGHYAKLMRSDTNDANKHSNDTNESIKPFGQELGAEWRTINDSLHSHAFVDSHRILLFRPKDLHKDQTYFLWQVPRERFARVLFPLGDYLKFEVRDIAREAKLPVAEKPDSTGICFIGEVSVEEFLKRLGVKEKEGEVVIRIAESGKRKAESARHDEKTPLRTSRFTLHASDYEVIGRHKGVAFYTIGQRHGFDVTSWPPSLPRHINIASLDSSSQTPRNDRNVDRPPLYVIEKNIEHNRLVVGFGAECYRSQFSCTQLNWLLDSRVWIVDSRKSEVKKSDSMIHDPLPTIACFVRIRHGGELIPCQLTVYSLQTTARETEIAVVRSQSAVVGTVRLSEPQRGIAAGQSAVFYSKEGIVLGGGVIQ